MSWGTLNYPDNRLPVFFCLTRAIDDGGPSIFMSLIETNQLLIRKMNHRSNPDVNKSDMSCFYCPVTAAADLGGIYESERLLVLP